jgi:phosphoribosyl-AMP cyclohydrolase
MNGFGTGSRRLGDQPAGGSLIEGLRFGSDGLIPAVVQQHDTGEVLMLGYMDREAVRRTVSSGRVWFWSRSRGEYWRKGDTSGNVQYLRSVNMDCDGDALLVRVEQIGPACHTGTRSCFDGREIPSDAAGEARLGIVGEGQG